MRVRLLSAFIILFLLTGCSYREEVKLNESGSIIQSATFSLSEEEIVSKSLLLTKEQLSFEQSLGALIAYFNNIGIKYVGLQDNMYTWYIGDQRDPSQGGLCHVISSYNKDSVVVCVADKFEVARISGVSISSFNIDDINSCSEVITLDKPVLKTNGVLHGENTVLYDCKSDNKNRVWVVSDLSLLKDYKVEFSVSQGYISRGSEVSFSCPDGIITDAYKNNTVLAYNSTVIDKNCKIDVVNGAGVHYVARYKIDDKTPITNIRDGKIYKQGKKITYTDKHSGIKKVVLNNRKIKSGYKVNKRGSYVLVLVDKVGNTKTVRFSVR